jgi:outer membrane protein assembly factor BamA
MFGRFVFLFLAFLSINAFSQDTLKKRSFFKKVVSQLTESENPILIIPLVNRSPETGWLGGLGIDYYFKLSNKNDSLNKARSSYLYLFGTVAETGQRNIEFEYQVYTTGEKYFLKGLTGFQHHYERYWGRGYHPLRDKYEEFYHNRFLFQGKAFRQIKKNNFLGINFHWEDDSKFEWFNNLSEIRINDAVGFTNNENFGIGPSIMLDYRDNPYAPVNGYFVDVSYSGFRRALGGKFNYDRLTTDFRKYIPLGKGKILCFQSLGVFTLSGRPPLIEHARLGGNIMLRGFFTGRFQDYQSVAFQSEMRMHVWKWLDFAGFASFGSVGEKFENLAGSRWHSSIGGGPRFLINKKEHIMARMDIAYTSENNFGFYINLFEAF